MREENNRFSWLARQITMYVAGGYMTDGKEENKALTQAQTIAFDEIEAAFLKELKEVQEESKENSNGSFERLMAAMGQSRAFQR